MIDSKQIKQIRQSLRYILKKYEIHLHKIWSSDEKVNILSLSKDVTEQKVLTFWIYNPLAIDKFKLSIELSEWEKDKLIFAADYKILNTNIKLLTNIIKNYLKNWQKLI